MAINHNVELLVITIYLVTQGNFTLVPQQAPNVLTTFEVI